MPRLLRVNTCEIPLLLRRMTAADEDPAIERARRHLERERAITFVLDVLGVLRDARHEDAA